MKNKKSILSLLLLSTIFSIPGSSNLNSINLPEIKSSIKKVVDESSAITNADVLIASNILNEKPQITNQEGGIVTYRLQNYFGSGRRLNPTTKLYEDYETIISNIMLSFKQKDNLFKVGRHYNFEFRKIGYHDKENGNGNGDLFSITASDYIDDVSVYYNEGEQMSYVGFSVIKEIPDESILFTYNSNTFSNHISVENPYPVDIDVQVNKVVEFWNSIFPSFNSKVIIDESYLTIVDGMTKDIYVNIDSEYTVPLIVSQFTAVDLFGIPVSVYVDYDQTDYVIGKLGDYTITLTATDDYGQTATAKINVHVVDATAPTIILLRPVVATASKGLSKQDLLNHLEIKDNVDSYEDLTISVTSSVLKFDSPVNCGSYSASVSATDKAGKTSTLNVTIDIIDDIPPTITRKDGNLMNSIIKVGVSAVDVNFEKSILSLFEFNDNLTESSLLSLSLIDSNVRQKVGVYTAKVCAIDENLNKTTEEINIEVIQDLPPVFIMSDALVVCDIANPLKVDDLKQIASYMLHTTTDNIDLIQQNTQVQDYLNNKTEGGEYKIQAYARDLGSFATFTLQVNYSPLYKDEVVWYKWIQSFFESFGTCMTKIFTQFKFEWVWILDNREIIM